MSESFEGRKVVVIGGGSGVAELSRRGKAWGITAEPTDRDQVPEVRMAGRNRRLRRSGPNHPQGVFL